jgi:hypothetical protein
VTGTTAKSRREWLQLRPWQRHSLVLAVAGIVYAIIGLVYLVVPLTADRASALRMALLLPIQFWGTVWITAGCLAFASTRWPPQSKTWGYSALAGLAALWGSFYLFGMLLLGSTHTALTGALVWYLVAFLWWAISGLVNPDDVLSEE